MPGWTTLFSNDYQTLCLVCGGGHAPESTRFLGVHPSTSSRSFELIEQPCAQVEAPAYCGNNSQEFVLPESLTGLDVFEGRELSPRSYSPIAGPMIRSCNAGVWQNGFTCIMRVRVDYSKNGTNIPLITSGSQKGHFAQYNRYLHLLLRNRKPYFGFGCNDLESGIEVAEQEWTWLAFVFDTKYGRRILINGTVVAEDSMRDPFSADDEISVGHIPTRLPETGGTDFFNGEIAALVFLRKELKDAEIRMLMRNWGYAMLCTDKVWYWLADVNLFIFSYFETILTAYVWRKILILRRRVTQLTDLIFDILVAIDYATTWEASYFPFQFEAAWDPWWAALSLIFTCLPFVAQFFLMARHGVEDLSKRGWARPCLIYCVGGLPLILFIKVILLFLPLNEMGCTSLSFMGAFEKTDLVVQAIFESVWQSFLSAYIFTRRVQLHREHGFPTMVFISFITSLLSLREAYLIVQLRSSWVGGTTLTRSASGALEGNTALGLLNATRLIVMGSRTEYCSIVGHAASPSMLMEVGNALEPQSTMERLTLTGNQIVDTHVLGSALKKTQALKYLNLSSNRIVNVQPLAEALEVNATIESLLIFGNFIQNVLPFKDALIQNQTLKLLNLAGNLIIDIHPFGDAIEVNKAIEVLDLSGNAIVDIARFGLGLHMNKSLLQLYLIGNRIDSIASFAEALKTHPLTVLQLSFNRIQDARPLATALEVNRALISLNLKGNLIQNMGSLAHALQTNDTLQRLAVTGNPIDNQDKAKLVNALRSHCTLTIEF